MKEIRDQLRQHGKARAKARAAVLRESAAIQALAPAALEAGLTKVEICKLAEITRPALDTMLKSAGHH